MLKVILLKVLVLIFISWPLFGEKKPTATPIWSSTPPQKIDKDPTPSVFISQPKNPNGTAVVICPGGGYGMVVIKPEGHGIAKWLNKHGVTAVVLKYRLPHGRNQVPLQDALRAIRYTRYKAKQLNIDPNKIGILGFSAGGHLAASTSVLFGEAMNNPKDPIDQVSSRPDFSILIYPVITMGEHTHNGSKNNLLGKNPTQNLIEKFSLEKQIKENTPPTFLAHAKDDKPVPIINSQLFYQGLKKQKVKAKLLELEKGGHGLNGYKGPSWDAWQKQSLEWLKELKLLKK